jgi:hypothetical protein
MRRHPIALAALVLLLFPGVPLRAEEPLVEQVRKAIDGGKKYLLDQQRQTDGSWEIHAELLGRRGGTTALVMLALLNAGVSPRDPALQKGLTYLRDIEPRYTYVVALQTMVFAQAGDPVDRSRIQRNVDWLLSARVADGWSYSRIGGDGGLRADNSNTQYALLGLHAGLRAGAIIKPKDLEAIRDLYIAMQRTRDGRDLGYWSYRGNASPTMTMTTAGLCGLLITGMDLYQGQQKLDLNTGVAANCGVYKENIPVARALQWIGLRFPAVIDNDTINTILSPPYYCLYGIERAGRLSGERFFGGHDWYEIGCRWLVKTQKADGRWQGDSSRRGHLDHWPAVATSFALLFLSKGRTPVLITKLAHGDRASLDWNNKRHDMPNLVEFASQELFKKMPLAWQIFDVRNSDPGREERQRLAEDLLPSPILYVHGHYFRPQSREKDIIKEYVENGGFLFAEACCGARQFDSDFKAVMKELFPDDRLTVLPDAHPVWTASGKFAVSPRDFPLYGIQRGCKTVVIYSPRPVSGYWEENLHDRGRGKDAFQLGANVIAYATGLVPPRPRLTRVRIVRTEEREKIKANYLKVAQLKHGGDWQPAPKAMRNLMAEMREVGLDVILETRGLHPSVEALLDYRFLYMHGRGAFTYAPEDLNYLRFNLKTGGTLLADACCGSKTFDESFRQFMKVLWAEENHKRDPKDQADPPEFKLIPIPVDDELFSEKLNGEAITRVMRRQLRPDGKSVAPEFRAFQPALEGVKYRGRWVVIYSKYDLGCALEKHQSSSCLGHDYESAVRLGRAAVLYALTR